MLLGGIERWDLRVLPAAGIDLPLEPRRCDNTRLALEVQGALGTRRNGLR